MTIDYYRKHHPEVASFLVKNTLLKWIKQVRDSPVVRRIVRRSVLSPEQEEIVAALILSMGQHGSLFQIVLHF